MDRKTPLLAATNALPSCTRHRRLHSSALAAALLATLVGALAPTFAGEPLTWGQYTHRLPSGLFETNTLVAPAGLTNVIEVASGLQHVAFLTAAGQVRAAGEWTWNQTNVPPNASNVVQISAGDYHTLARTLDGAVRAWGANYNNQCLVPAAATNSVHVAAGGFHSFSLSASGVLTSWGDNRYGQATPPPGLSNVVAVAGGAFHSLALRADGRVVAWGGNAGGQTNVPANLSNVVAIAARDEYSLALKSDGTVVGWGSNATGRLSFPAGLTGVKRIATGDRHVLALKQNGQLAAWGGNSTGQTTVPAAAATNSTAIGAGSLHSAVVIGGTVPNFLRSPASVTLLPGGGATLSGFALGTAPMTYQWRHAGTNLPGATQPALSLANAGARHTGTYTLVASNAWGVTTAQASVIVTGEPPVITEAPEDLSGVLGTTVQLTVEATGTAPLAYQWSFNGSDLSAATTTRLTFPSLALNHAGNYRVRVMNDYGAATSAAVALTVELTGSSPQLTQQPASTSVIIAEAVRLSANANGSAPLVWQWYHNGAAKPGATRRYYQLAQAAASDAGSYFVTVTNLYGARTSQIAVLTTIGLPPSLITPPASVSSAVGATVTLTVGATGTAPLLYQWQRAGTNLPGATSSSLTIANAQTNQSGAYQVRVQNGYGVTNSPAATVLIEQPNPPAITTHPTARTNYVGDCFSLTVIATGEAPLRYQWKLNGTALPGATHSSYQICPAATNLSGSYQVTVTNRWGTRQSLLAAVTITDPPTPPVITAEPENAIHLPGATAVLSVGVTGTEPLVYKWRKNGTVLANNSRITGANQSVLRVANFGAADAGQYQVSVTNAAGWVQSLPAVLSLAPTNQSSAALLGENTNTCGNWRGVFGNSGCVVIGNLTNLPPGVSMITGNTTNGLWAVDTSVAQALSKATSTNVNDRIAANWNNFTNFWIDLVLNQPYTISLYSMDWNNLGASQRVDILPSATGLPMASGTVSNFAAGKYLRFQVSGSVRVKVTSLKPISAMISGLFFDSAGGPSISQQPLSRTNAVGTAASFTVVAGGAAPLGFQWRHNGSPVASATTSSLTLASVTTAHAGAYTVVVTNAAGSVTSAIATLTVLVPPTITSQPQSQTVARGANVSLLVNATGSAPLGYLWRKGGVLVGGNTNRLDLTNVQPGDAGEYRVEVSNSVGSVPSAIAVVSVVEPPTIVTPPADRLVLQGASASFSVAAQGTPPLSYHWRKDGVLLPGATAAAISLPAVTVADSGTYSVTASNLAGIASASAGLTVVLPVTLTSNPANVTVVRGEPCALTVGASGTGPLTYEWSKNGALLTGAASPVLAIAAAETDDAGSYQVVVRNPYSAATSSLAIVTVVVPPSLILEPESAIVLAGSQATLAAAAEGTAPLSYQWFHNAAAVPGGTANELHFTAVSVQATGDYYLVVTNPWGSATSSVATLTVVTPPSFLSQPQSLTTLRGTTATIAVSAAGTQPMTFQWFKDGAALPGATRAELQVTDAQVSDTGSYCVVVANAYGSVTSESARLEVVIAAAVLASPVGQTVLVGETISLNAVVEGTEPMARTWTRNGVPLVGPTTDTVNISAAGLEHAGGYAVIVSNAWGAATSAVATVVVSLPPNLNPVAADDTLVLPGGGPRAITVAELLANDFDPDGGALFLAGVSPMSQRGGTLVRDGDTITFTPQAAGHLWDAFDYQIEDDRGGTATARVLLRLEDQSNGSAVEPPGLTQGETGLELQLSFSGLPLATYQIEAASHAAGPWEVVGTATADANGNFSFVDPAVESRGSRFYRTRLP